MEEFVKIVDIEKIIKNGDSKFFRSLPLFIIKTIERIIQQDEMNLAYQRSRYLTGVPFINDVLEGFNVNVDIKGFKNIPESGRFIFVANHPLGAIDTLALFSVIYRAYPDVKSLTNEMLAFLPNFSPLILGINVYGKNTRETAAKLIQLFDSDTQILTFPSGEVSRKKNKIISDPDWQKSFITKSVQHKRDIIPVHISGRNSKLFYFIANLRKFLGIKMYIESALLPREMLKKRNSTITLTIGNVIPYQTFTNEKTPWEWAQFIKENVYKLPG